MTKSNKPIIVEQVFNSSIKEVWDAITELEQMKLWFFTNIPAFEPVIGFQTKFNVQSGERNFEHLWKIVEVEANKKIKYHWSYSEYEGVAFVTFELFQKNEQTLLRLTNEGLETFTSDIPEFTRDSCIGGWEFFIKKNLKDYLDQKK
jgi:uncharacterized protein YndB with AHSA1/START domain